MAVAISEAVAELVSTSNTATYSTTSFTPTANALLVVKVFADGTVADGAMSGGSLTWTRLGRRLYNSADSAYTFIAQVGGSPSSMNATFTCTGDNAGGVVIIVFQVTGHNTLCPIWSYVSENRTAANPTCTRPAAHTSNAYLAGFGGPRNPPNATAPSGWTEIADSGVGTPTQGASAAYRAGGETSTSVTFTCASFAYGIVYTEICEASVSPPAPTIVSVLPTSGGEAGGTSVTITGTGFQPDMAVSFGGNAATSVVMTSSTTLTCVTPAGTGVSDVVITLPDAQTSTGGDDAFEYIAPTQIETAVATYGTLYRLYAGGYDSTTGTWPCRLGSGDATQGTSANRPANTTTPGGDNAPDFDGAAPSNQDQLTASGLPGYSYSSGGHYAFFLHAALDSSQSLSVLAGWNSAGGIDDDVITLSNAAVTYALHCGAARTDANVVTGSPLRIIGVKNGTTGIFTLYVDGVAQANTDTPHVLGTDWGSGGGLSIGTQPGSTDRRIGGAIYSLGFARITDAADIADFVTDVDAALEDWYQNGVPVGGGTSEIAGSSDGSSTATAALSATGALAGSTSAAASATAAIAGFAELAGSSSGVATAAAAGSLTLRASGAAAGSAAASADASAIGKLAGGAASASTAGATCSASGRLSASAGASAAASASARGLGALSGAAAGAGAADGTLQSVADNSISGSTSGSSSSTASLSGTGRLAGSGAGEGAAAGGVGGSGAMAGIAASFAIAAAVLLAIGGLSADVGASSSASGALSAIGALSGSAGGSSTAAAGVDLGRTSGTAAGTATSSATLRGLARTSAAADGKATCSASSGAIASVSGVALGSASSSATVGGVGRCFGVTSGSSSAAASGALLGSMTAAADGVCAAGGHLSATGTLSGTTDGTCVADGSVTGLGDLFRDAGAARLTSSLVTSSTTISSSRSSFAASAETSSAEVGSHASSLSAGSRKSSVRS